MWWSKDSIVRPESGLSSNRYEGHSRDDENGPSESLAGHLLAEDERAERRREEDARLTYRGDRRRRSELEGCEDERVGAEGRDRSGQRRRPDRRTERAEPPGCDLGSNGGQCNGREDELEIGDRRRVLDALVVDKRVAGDGRGDPDRRA